MSAADFLRWAGMFGGVQPAQRGHMELATEDLGEYDRGYVFVDPDGGQSVPVVLLFPDSTLLAGFRNTIGPHIPTVSRATPRPAYA